MIDPKQAFKAELIKIAKEICASGKGILAADESTASEQMACPDRRSDGRRFDSGPVGAQCPSAGSGRRFDAEKARRAERKGGVKLFVRHAVSPGLSKARGLKRRPLALHPLPGFEHGFIDMMPISLRS